ncbi:glucose-6-phosphate isomerase [Roseovarius nanhaiticus]|uniref:Glucose-6-phosphate isomerase n=1 Tax=Roseovarius nanhaiticus TaxID=573024 RepID=A0A1N7HLN7_9RHOB|nr:glucose-6-phosphate isomerase [Roseovarius nanhaiticus]SEL28670.1 glucose-6-phosphate isomerase [Roseovarius nanhaiticus]SIS25766.1 glucose-6-phosphate isomerase [Roseovarius nanhaiticus]
MSDVWSKLRINHRNAEAAGRSITDLFRAPDRFDTFSARSDGMLLDVSKTGIDAAALDLLLALAQEADVAGMRAAMFRGDRINFTEDRAVLHTALRARETKPLVVDGGDIRPAIQHTLDQMNDFAREVRSGGLKTAEGGRFSDVVNIGIGGSDLGPAMATAALAPYHDGPRCHFVSNVDGAHITDVLRGLDPATTLVIIASKTFTTTETMTNARTAIHWLRSALGNGATSHLAAVSTALDRTAELGIPGARVFGFADWVGGRYSLWGPVGLPIMLAIGPERFREFLDGGTAMDAHFCTAEPRENMPLLMGLVGIWHRDICGYGTRAVLPYDQRLARLPAYLQQLDMESNGKRVTRSGEVAAHGTGPIVWGEAGTNGQHAFFQLLHQGTQVVPAEFLIAAEGHEPELGAHHDLLKANCLAQSEALMTGRSFDAALEIARAAGFEGDAARRQAQHRTFPGNRPSITLAYPKLTPFALGQIIALYEHRVFVEGIIWGINSFDQWGVELGKELANALLPLVRDEGGEAKNASTQGLLDALRR